MENWLWFGALVLTNGLMFVSCRLRYKFGIWDGAFNQFLPRVQAAMREYDADRAEEILSKRKSWIDGTRWTP